MANIYVGISYTIFFDDLVKAESMDCRQCQHHSRQHLRKGDEKIDVLFSII